MSFQCTRRASNTTHLTLLAAAVLASLGTSAWAAAPAPIPGSASNSRAAVERDWVEQALELIRRLYILMGGNPADLESRDSVESTLSLVSDFYWTHGLPTLDPEARASLVQTIHDLYAILGNPPSSVNPQAASGFRKTLMAMWVALGLDPLDLER